MNNDARIVAGVHPQDAETVLKQRHQTLERSTLAEQGAVQRITVAERQVSAREAQLGRVLEAAKVLQKQEREKKALRKRTIYRHVSSHLREVKHLAEAKDHDFNIVMNELASLQLADDGIVRQIQVAGRELGLETDDPDEIEEILGLMVARNASLLKHATD